MFLVLSCNRDKVRCAARYTACGGIQLLSSRVEFRCGVQMMVDAAGPNVGQENVPMHHHSSHQTSNESIHNVYQKPVDLPFSSSGQKPQSGCVFSLQQQKPEREMSSKMSRQRDEEGKGKKGKERRGEGKGS